MLQIMDVISVASNAIIASCGVYGLTKWREEKKHSLIASFYYNSIHLSYNILDILKSITHARSLNFSEDDLMRELAMHVEESRRSDDFYYIFHCFLLIDKNYKSLVELQIKINEAKSLGVYDIEALFSEIYNSILEVKNICENFLIDYTKKSLNLNEKEIVATIGDRHNNLDKSKLGTMQSYIENTILPLLFNKISVHYS